MKKKIGKWIISILVIILAIASVFYYEVYISYNNLTENNHTIENKK